MATVPRGAGRGALIGFLGGIGTGGAMILVMVLYEVANPDQRFGSRAVLGPETALAGVCAPLCTICWRCSF
jgi:hypothetical protein